MGAALDGTVGRRSAPVARPAAQARPLDAVVPAGRQAARPPLARLPASTSRSRAPGRTSVPGPGQLCRRRRPLSGTLTRCQDWRDRHLRFHFNDQLEASPHIGDLLCEIDRDRPRSSGDSPSRLRRPQWRCLTARLPIRAARHPVSLGYDSSGISRTAPDHPGNPVAVTSPKRL